MSKSTLQELGLKAEAIQADAALADLPEGFGPLREPLQPGTYRFKLPEKNLETLWEKFEADEPTKDQSGAESTQSVERIRATFDADAPLQVIQCPTGVPDRTGEPFETRISNVRRWRDREHSTRASDMDYLLKALGEAVTPMTNVEYAQALMKHAGKEFTADVELSYYSNPNRTIRALVADQGGQVSIQEIPGAMGNGSRQRAGTGAQDVGRDAETHLYPAEIQVAIPATAADGSPASWTAVVRGFNNLTRIRV